MALLLEKVSPQGVVQRQAIEIGRNRFVAEPGFKYRIVDDALDAKRIDAKARRIGDELTIEDLPDQTVVEFEGFFTRCTPEQSCTVSMEGLSSGAVTEITPASQPVAAMTDGSFLMSSAPAASSITPMAAEGAGMGVKIGGLALVGVGLAAAGGGGGGGGGGDGPPPPVPQALTITSANLSGATRPTFTGTGTPGERLAITITGPGVTSVFYNVTVAADGQWTLNTATTPPLGGALPAGGLGEGTYTITVHSPTAGSVDATQSLAIDLTPPAAPVITSPATGGSINATQARAGVVIQGTAEAGATVTLTWVGLTITTTADANGAWTATFSGSQIAGSGDVRAIVATATDVAGNISGASAAVSLTLQTGQPAAPIFNVVANDNVINAAERGAGVTLSGTTSPNAVVTLVWGSSTHSATANAQGQWSIAFAAGEIPADGTSSIAATARDGFGNTTPSTHSVLIDTTPPAVPTNIATSAGTVVNAAENGGPIDVTGRADPNTSVTVTWGNTSKTVTSLSDGTWSATFTTAERPAGDGSRPITAYTSDVHGNNSAVQTLPIFVDTFSTTPSNINTSAGSTIDFSEYPGAISVTGTAEPNARVTVNWGTGSREVVADGSGNWTATFSGADNLPSNSTIRVTAVDQAGNLSAEATRGITFSLTTPAPTITGLNTGDLINIAEYAGTMTVSGTATAGMRVDVNWGSATRSVTTSGAGTWSANFTSADGVSSDTSISATAISSTGISSATATRSVSFDLAAPAAPVITGPIATNDIVDAGERAAGVMVSGTAEGSSTVRVTWGGDTKTVVASSGGAWSTTFASGDAIGTGATTISVTAEDAAGNISTAATRPVTVNGAATPTPSINAVSIDDIVGAAELTGGVAVSGTAEAGSAVAVTWGGVTRPTTAAAVTGAWSVTFTNPADAIDAADASISVTATNSGGTPSAAATRPVTVDLTPPAQTFVSFLHEETPGGVQVGDAGSTSDTTPHLTITLSALLAADESLVVLRDSVILGPVTSVGGGVYTLDDAGLTDRAAPYVYSAYLSDTAGNTTELTPLFTHSFIVTP